MNTPGSRWLFVVCMTILAVLSIALIRVCVIALIWIVKAVHSL